MLSDHRSLLNIFLTITLFREASELEHLRARLQGLPAPAGLTNPAATGLLADLLAEFLRQVKNKDNERRLYPAIKR